MMTTNTNEVTMSGKSTNLPADFDVSKYQVKAAQEDIIIPRLLLMQPMSPQVVEDLAKIGSVIEGSTNKRIDVEGKLDVIPVTYKKKWVVQKRVPGKTKAEWVRNEEYSEGAPYEFQEGADTLFRTRVYDFLVLLPNDLTKPYLLAMKSTSTQAARQITTVMTHTAPSRGLPSFGIVCELTARIVTKDGNKWAQFDAKEKRLSEVKEMEKAATLFDSVCEKEVRSDVENDNEDVPF